METMLFLVALLFLVGAQAVPYPVDRVDPRIGTGSRIWGIGHNNPGAQVPFGALRLGPDTSRGEFWWVVEHYSGYYWGDTHIRAFSHTHMVGAGLPDLGNFGVMAFRLREPLPETIRNYGYKSYFTHDREEMHPGYYKVYLESHGVTAELVAAGTHAGIHRYIYDPGNPVSILFDICHGLGYEPPCYMADVVVTVYPDLIEIRGFTQFGGALTRMNSKGVPIFFYARVTSSTPFQDLGLWANKTVYPGVFARKGETSNSLGVYLNFEGLSGVIEVEVGISFVSAENAEYNLDAQLRSRTFDQVVIDTTEIWKAELATITLKTQRSSEETKFWTSYYRTLMSPTIYDEANGLYPGMDENIYEIESGRHFYSDLSLWDTFRTQNPWLLLIRPKVGEDIFRSLILMGLQGGVVPFWPIVNVYTGCMFGHTYNQGFLDAYRKGLLSLNELSLIYPTIRKGGVEMLPHDTRLYLESYLKYGYVPLEVTSKGTPETLLYIQNDWALAEIARLLNKTSDFEMFGERAKWYRNIFDPNHLWMCPKTASGEFKCPVLPNLPYHPNYIEGNVNHYTWDVPHDIDGFISLWPSVEIFVSRLEEILIKNTEVILPFNKNWFPNPYYWVGNEHDMMFPWMFNKAGRTDLTQFWTRWLLENRWTDQPDGLPGMDDYGTMSAWYIFGSIGLYPNTGMDWYFIGSPVHDFIQLGNLTIQTINNSPTNVYVESLLVNGEKWLSPYISHGQLQKAELIFYMTDNPESEFNLQNTEYQRWYRDKPRTIKRERPWSIKTIRYPE